MEFLYYRSGDSQREPAELAYVFERSPLTHQVIANGPCGGSGIVFASGGYHERSNRVGVYHDQQIWQKYPVPNLWIGWYKDEPPRPADLARAKQIPGKDLILGDGNSWTVPIAIAFIDGGDGVLRRTVMLPQRMELGDDGAWIVGDVIAQHAALYRVARSWWDGEDGLTVADATHWCCTALATNYRISPVEASILRLFDTDSYKQILNTVIDLDTLIRRQSLEKKSETSATLSTELGSVA